MDRCMTYGPDEENNTKTEKMVNKALQTSTL